MRKLLAAAVVAVGSLVTGVTGAASQATGLLTGETQISFGCPGPMREGGTCNPWHAFPNARFSIAQRRADGSPAPNARVVTSGAAARFSIRLATGFYLVTPARQQNTNGGERLTVRIRAGETTKIVVRFIGFPQME